MFQIEIIECSCDTYYNCFVWSDLDNSVTCLFSNLGMHCQTLIFIDYGDFKNSICLYVSV